MIIFIEESDKMSTEVVTAGVMTGLLSRYLPGAAEETLHNPVGIAALWDEIRTSRYEHKGGLLSRDLATSSVFTFNLTGVKINRNVFVLSVFVCVCVFMCVSVFALAQCRDYINTR
jgi:hypothetical protein